MIYTLMNPKADPARACMHIWGGASILGGGWGQSDPHLIFLPLLRLGTSPHALHTHSYYLNASCVGRANANSMCVRHFPHLTLPYYPQASHRQATGKPQFGDVAAWGLSLRLFIDGTRI